jgi:hypothetical protein
MKIKRHAPTFNGLDCHLNHIETDLLKEILLTYSSVQDPAQDKVEDFRLNSKHPVGAQSLAPYTETVPD